MADLEFSFKEVLDEIHAFDRIANRFIAGESAGVLRAFYESLRRIRDARSTDRQRWEIPRRQPVRTIPSVGEYEPGGHGEHTVYAELSCLWEITPVVPRKQSHPLQIFRLTGIASTEVHLFESRDGEPRELGTWKMEIGDNASPGCHYHVQMRRDVADPPFPRSLSIPRFPIFFVSPLLALEFVVAELFQEEWPRQLRETSELGRWRSIHLQRLDQFFVWQLTEVRRGYRLGTPLLQLKALKPESALFRSE